MRKILLVLFAFFVSFPAFSKDMRHQFLEDAKPRQTLNEFLGAVQKEKKQALFLKWVNEHPQFKEQGVSFRNYSAFKHYADQMFDIRPCEWTKENAPDVQTYDATRRDGDHWWERGCYKGEMIAYDGEVPIFSLLCGNFLREKDRPELKVTPPETPQRAVKRKPPRTKEVCHSEVYVVPGDKGIYIATHKAAIGIHSSENITVIKEQCFEGENE